MCGFVQIADCHSERRMLHWDYTVRNSFFGQSCIRAGCVCASVLLIFSIKGIFLDNESDNVVFDRKAGGLSLRQDSFRNLLQDLVDMGEQMFYYKERTFVLFRRIGKEIKYGKG